jgi:hypothetical protein
MGTCMFGGWWLMCVVVGVCLYPYLPITWCGVQVIHVVEAQAGHNVHHRAQELSVIPRYMLTHALPHSHAHPQYISMCTTTLVIIRDADARA